MKRSLIMRTPRSAFVPVLLLALLILFPTVALAQGPVRIFGTSPTGTAVPIMVTAGGALTADDLITTGKTFELLAVADTAVGLATGTLNPTGGAVTVCRGVALTAQMNYMYTGTAPTATTVGIPIEIGDRITIRGTTNLSQFKIIRTTATSGELRVTCER
jgi:hypothetical protein